MKPVAAQRPLSAPRAIDRPYPHGHRKTIAFVAGLRYRPIVAPLVIDGAMNSNVWFRYGFSKVPAASVLFTWAMRR
jgi:hypothetical protein